MMHKKEKNMYMSHTFSQDVRNIFFYLILKRNIHYTTFVSNAIALHPSYRQNNNQEKCTGICLNGFIWFYI